jgi:hypothetical protein
MLVVLDANILIADFRMQGNPFRILMTDGGQAGIRVGLPEVVVREATRKLRLELGDRAPRLAKLTGELRQRLVDGKIDIDIDAIADGYERRLRALTDGSLGWELLPLPDVDHADVLERVHRSGAPARGDGKGYQDILIWETLKANLHRDSHMVLVSNDGDFAGPDGQLDAELAAEASRVCPDVRLELVRSLKALVEEHIAPHLIDGFWQGFDRSRRTDFEHALGERLNGLWLSQDLREAVTPAAGEAWISWVRDMSDVETRDARMLSDGQIAFEMRADVEALIGTDISDDAHDDPMLACLAVRAEARWDPASSQPTHIGLLDLEFNG